MHRRTETDLSIVQGDANQPQIKKLKLPAEVQEHADAAGRQDWKTTNWEKLLREYVGQKKAGSNSKKVVLAIEALINVADAQGKIGQVLNDKQKDMLSEARELLGNTGSYATIPV